MQVLKTIPGVPAIAAIVDAVYRVNIMSIDFVAGTVTFTVVTDYQPQFNINNVASAPVSRIVSFTEIGTLALPADINGFVAVVRQALALAMNVPIAKVPVDIFSK